MPGKDAKVDGLGVNTKETDDDEFGAAFEEATDESSDLDNKAEALEKERAEGKGKDEDDTGKDDDDAGDKAKAGTESTETDDDKAKQEPEDWEQKYKSLQGVIKGLQDENETLKKGTDDPEKKSEGDKKKPDTIDLVKLAEDDPVIKEFVEEYDYLVEPFQAILSRVASNRPSISPEDLAFIHHSATITAAHPEYPRITQFNDKGESELKSFVQNYAGDDKERVAGAYEKGNTAEVIWLVDQFKASKKGPNEGKKKKLDNLSAVESKSTAVNAKAKDDGDDSFEAGFESAARKK